MSLWNFAIVLFVCLHTIVAVIRVVGIYGTIGWEFGTIQVVAVPTVVGSIDYALHVTHSFIQIMVISNYQLLMRLVVVYLHPMTTISYYAVGIFDDLGWIVATTTSCGILIGIFVCQD